MSSKKYDNRQSIRHTDNLSLTLLKIYVYYFLARFIHKIFKGAK